MRMGPDGAPDVVDGAGASAAAAADRAARDLERAAAANPPAARAGRRARTRRSAARRRVWTSRSSRRLPTARAASCSTAATASSSRSARCPAKRRCFRRRFSAPTPSRCRRPKSLLAHDTRPAIRFSGATAASRRSRSAVESFVDCTSNPGAARSAEARRRGATFRALGNEPSWVLEISPQQLTLTTELGQRRTEFPYRDPMRRRRADDVSLLRRHARARRRDRPHAVQRHDERRAVRQHRRRHARKHDVVRLRAEPLDSRGR